MKALLLSFVLMASVLSSGAYALVHVLDESVPKVAHSKPTQQVKPEVAQILALM